MEMQKSASEESTLIKRNGDESEQPDQRGCSTCCKFPTSIFFIVVNEFCERFYYYGMRTILMLYLIDHVGLMTNDAAALFHSWVAITYFTPLLGGILADSYFGKYKIILWFSILYMIGAILMSVTSIPAPNLAGPSISLVMIAFGGGCIKACTSAFGGDQIAVDKKNPKSTIKLQESYFSVFYFAINAGSFLSSIITPLLRAKVTCSAENTCFPLAFGFPAILMFIAIVVFVCGKSRYVIKPPSSSVILRSIQCCFHGFRVYLKDRKEVKKNSWIDYANDEYDQSFINDIKVVSRILLLFVPILVFWSLFDQQSSLWIVQGSMMNGYISKNFSILCDQMVVLNPILILLFIPLFESCFYPFIEFIGIPNKPLRRMTVGMFLAANAFLISFFVQLKIERERSEPVPDGWAGLGLVSLSDDCNLEASYEEVELTTTSPFVTSGKALFPAGALIFNLLLNCKTGQTKTQAPLALLSKKNFELYGWQEESTLRYKLVEHRLKGDKRGRPLVRAIYRENAHTISGVILTTKGYSYHLTAKSTEELIMTPFEPVFPGKYSVTVVKNNTKDFSHLLNVHLELESGKAISLLPHRDSDGTWLLGSVTELKENSVHILLQIPQHILLTSAEILVSITGLSYAYTQAPESMKATVTALSLISVGIGNLVVVIVAESVKSNKISPILLIFTLLAYITGVIFGIDAYFYVPNDPH